MCERAGTKSLKERGSSARRLFVLAADENLDGFPRVLCALRALVERR